MPRSVSEKMGLKPDQRAIFLNAPEEAIKAIAPPALQRETTLNGDFDYIFFFAYTQAEFHQLFPSLKSHLKPTGTLWLCWPKGGQQNTDLTLTKVIKLGYDYGLVESTCLSVNAIWSALKFTHPKEGKNYNNKYGKLKI